MRISNPPQFKPEQISGKNKIGVSFSLQVLNVLFKKFQLNYLIIAPSSFFPSFLVACLIILMKALENFDGYAVRFGSFTKPLFSFCFSVRSKPLFLNHGHCKSPDFQLLMWWSCVQLLCERLYTKVSRTMS